MAENMVLRSVYLPPEVDGELRARAFRENISKNELIRKLVEKGIREVEEAERSEQQAMERHDVR